MKLRSAATRARRRRWACGWPPARCQRAAGCWSCARRAGARPPCTSTLALPATTRLHRHGVQGNNIAKNHNWAPAVKIHVVGTLKLREPRALLSWCRWRRHACTSIMHTHVFILGHKDLTSVASATRAHTVGKGQAPPAQCKGASVTSCYLTELSRGAACAGLPAHAGLGRAAVVRCRGAVLSASRRAGRGARAPPQRAAPGALPLPYLPQSYCPAVPASCKAGYGASYAAESAALGAHRPGVPRRAPAKTLQLWSGFLRLCEMHSASAHHIGNVAPQTLAIEQT